jgi:hypothetical protein
MTRRRKRWIIIAASVAAATVVGLFVAAAILSRRIEPFIREQAIAYMSERFNSDVTIEKLRIRMPRLSPVRLVLMKGRGAVAGVEGEGISMRFRGSGTDRPLFSIRKFRGDVDLGSLGDRPIRVTLIALDGVEINVPPKGDRPKVAVNASPQQPDQPPRVLIDHIQMTQTRLSLLPKEASKKPLEFDIHSLRLDSAGIDVAMKYHAALTNPKPPGQIDSYGTFGPWNTDEPGDTPLSGKYTFEKADLSVFSGIAGILHSTGEFQGALSSITARGEATVPDFRLTMANNPVPLKTNFEVLVDGTNGNTVLQPVKAMLGSTRFTTSGGVIKHEGDKRRTISLDVLMPNGELRDLLLLAMKGTPFMEGTIALKTKIEIPPLTGTVRDKLLLDGSFRVSNGKFLKSRIQEKLDGLSRRGQGDPKNEGIDQVVSNMRGRFRLQNEVITFRNLTFGVPGASVDLAGDYDMDADLLDFRGALKLSAKVSQTMTGWKRWALKPVDPLLSKNGAGTYLPIKIEGSSRDPKFGLAFGGGDDSERARKGATR